MKGKKLFACLLVGGICCITVGCEKEEKGTLAKEIRLQNAQITGVELDWSRGNIEIDQSGDGEVYAVGEEDDSLRYYVEEGILKIERKEGRSRAERATLRVEIPVGLSLEVDSDQAEVTLGVLEVERLSVETDNGNISAEKLTCRQAEFDSDEGSIYIGEIAADRVEAESQNGEVQMGFSKPVCAQLSTERGEVRLFLLSGVGGRVRFESKKGKLQTGLAYEKQNEEYLFAGEQSCSVRVRTGEGNLVIE